MSAIKEISVVGVKAELVPIDKSQLKGLNADILLRFIFYKTTFNHQDLCVIQLKNQEGYTPLKYRRLTEQIGEVFGVPVAVWLDTLSFYERERLINQGVYFIVSDNYAFLPSLIVNTKVRNKDKSAEQLSPAAQYVLLYYLLSETVSELIIKELERIMTYSYLTLSRAITNLEDCNLCKAEKKQKTKIIRFEMEKKELWNKAQKYLLSPVKKTVYANSIPDGDFPICGVNALSHYSHLNPDNYSSVAIWEKDFQSLDMEYNEIEGLHTIEIWKYPPVLPLQKGKKVIDKLSMYLSLKDNPDARIEKELEIVIEEMKW